MKLTVIIIVALVLGICLVMWRTERRIRRAAISESNAVRQPQMRVSLPEVGDFYTFHLDSPLTNMEWERLAAGGWELVTCNNEGYEDYISTAPCAPKVKRTRWYYVFHRAQQV